MNILDVNIGLKEDISLLEKMYRELYDEYYSMCYVPNMVHSNLKMLNFICKEQIKAQKDEKTCQMKYESVEKFATYIGMMTELTLEYFEDKYNIE